MSWTYYKGLFKVAKYATQSWRLSQKYGREDGNLRLISGVAAAVAVMENTLSRIGI